MLDKNGIEMRTGDIVRISNAYFKNDNGLYYVEYSPGDPSWCGEGYALIKVKRNGQISTAKYRHASWPLCSFLSDQRKNAMADDWNLRQGKAEIEIVTGIDRSYIAEFFQEKADRQEKQRKYHEYNWGKDHPETVKIAGYRDFYQSVADRIKAEDNIQDAQEDTAEEIAETPAEDALEDAAQDTAQDAQYGSDAQYAENRKAGMSNQDILNALAGLECALYYRHDGSDSLEGISQEDTDTAHAAIKEALDFWYRVSGCKFTA